MKLVDVYKSTLGAPKGLKNKEISLKNPSVPDTYDPNIPKSQKPKVSAVLFKPLGDDSIRYVKVSLLDNKMLLPEKLRKIDFDTVVGFYKTDMDLDIDQKTGTVDKFKYTPKDNVYFVFNLTKQTDRVKVKFFKDLLDRKGIPHIFADALEGFDDEDFKSLSDRDIRLQGLYELISIPFTAFQINRTEAV